jgi:hypothetical protein
MFSWFLMKLCIFSGEDYFIISKCKFNIKLRFAMIGFFVMLVFVGCFISAALFVAHLFQGAKGLCFIIGTIWAIMITNLYLLLLYTVTPYLLPVATKRKVRKDSKTSKKTIEEAPEEKGRKKRFYFSFSYVFRLSLISLLAIIIVQPFNVLLFSPSFEEANRYANEIKRILHTQPLSWLITLLGCGVFLLPVYYKFHIRTLSQKNYDEDFKSMQSDKELLTLRNEIVNTDDYEQLSKRILALDMSQIKTSDFYFQKAIIEMRLILEEYEVCKKTYCHLLSEKVRMYNSHLIESITPFINSIKTINLEKSRLIISEINEEVREEKVEKYEYWADAPFRTKRKSVKRRLAKEEDLLKAFYENRI